ncbi:hypothetical protein BDV30DRAFT_70838 [Aspergillus minisclerotigenes]|uniref:Uncharacterized protein n=1 Tax=Aspergillus minisclerotigenes TaxID=656917 RepID=A0A5N6IN02_9EURO|nr:hypothetical protein BDV30DRAFT_70838 [Aspergillus minisclerotigenes]
MVMEKGINTKRRFSASRMPAWLCRPFNELGRSTNSSSQGKNTFCKYRLISTTNVVGTQGPGCRTIRGSCGRYFTDFTLISSFRLPLPSPRKVPRLYPWWHSSSKSSRHVETQNLSVAACRVFSVFSIPDILISEVQDSTDTSVVDHDALGCRSQWINRIWCCSATARRPGNSAT